MEAAAAAAATTGKMLPSAPRYVPFIIASSISCSFFRSSSLSGYRYTHTVGIKFELFIIKFKKFKQK